MSRRTKTAQQQQYFEDMWLDLSADLDKFDNFSSSEFNFINDSSQQSTSEDKTFKDQDLPAQTYEQLLNLQNSPDPSYQETHSTDFKERIEAIRQLYNKNPVLLNASTISRLRKVASNLSKKGLVKQANQISNFKARNLTFRSNKDGIDKVFNYVENVGGEKYVTVNISTDNYDYSQDFDNVEEAISFFHNPSLKD